jgi:hypothetical protein
LLGVRGNVIITHGRAKRRMIGYAVEVGARSARERLPELITAALREPGTATAVSGGQSPTATTPDTPVVAGADAAP